MDLEKIIQDEKLKVNAMIQRVMDSSRFEQLKPDEYVIDNIEEFKGEDVGSTLMVYYHSEKEPFADEHYLLTSYIDKLEIVEVVPQIGKDGKLNGFRYYAIWSSFWFFNGIQYSHTGCFTRLEQEGDKRLVKLTGLGDDEQGQYDLLLTTFEMEIDEEKAIMVKEWNDYKKKDPEGIKLARDSVYEEFTRIIGRWMSG